MTDGIKLTDEQVAAEPSDVLDAGLEALATLASMHRNSRAYAVKIKDEMIKGASDIMRLQASELTRCREDNARLRALVEEAAEVLGPFARKAQHKDAVHKSAGYKNPLADSLQIAHRLVDFRRASALADKIKGAGQ